MIEVNEIKGVGVGGDESSEGHLSSGHPNGVFIFLERTRCPPDVLRHILK